MAPCRSAGFYPPRRIRREWKLRSQQLTKTGYGKGRIREARDYLHSTLSRRLTSPRRTLWKSYCLCLFWPDIQQEWFSNYMFTPDRFIDWWWFNALSHVYFRDRLGQIRCVEKYFSSYIRLMMEKQFFHLRLYSLESDINATGRQQLSKFHVSGDSAGVDWLLVSNCHQWPRTTSLNFLMEREPSSNKTRLCSVARSL